MARVAAISTVNNGATTIGSIARNKRSAGSTCPASVAAQSSAPVEALKSVAASIDRTREAEGFCN